MFSLLSQKIGLTFQVNCVHTADDKVIIFIFLFFFFFFFFFFLFFFVCFFQKLKSNPVFWEK